jgi:AbrB family transcriptional regulator (stage V sporulation protein T)
MTAKLKLDRLGRIVLPKAVREKLQVSAGDQFELESSDDRITLRPMRGNAQLRKKRGVWVFQSGEPLSEVTVQQTIEQIRRERDDQNRGRNT